MTLLPGSAKPPPHPVIAVAAPREASSSKTSVIQRRPRLAAANSRPSMGSPATANSQPEAEPAVVATGAAVWMLSVEVADELPGVIEAGLKVAVAPTGNPFAARMTALGKLPFSAVAVMVYCAVPPGWTVCVVVDEVTAYVGGGGAVPVPLRVTVWGEAAALSAMETIAEKFAGEAGVKVTEIEQLAPAARELPQVLVCAKPEASVPPSVTALMVNGALPVFLSVAI